MPTYRIHWPDRPPELLEANSVRVEGIHQVLRGTVLVIGIPRENVLRRVPLNLLVQAVEPEVSAGKRPSWPVL